MKCGQHIIFDENHHSGVYERVQEKMEKVHDIYENPDKYDEKTLEHHTSVALRELALEEVRRKKYPQFPSRMSCLYVSRTLKEAEQTKNISRKSVRCWWMGILWLLKL